MNIATRPSAHANIFWSHQFSIPGARVGYVGTQTVQDEKGANLWLFSVWGATDCRPNLEYGGHCVGTTDGDPGRSVRIYYPWAAGEEYLITVQPSLSDPEWWNATLTEVSTANKVSIGDLRFNASVILPLASWVEYWNWNSRKSLCRNQEPSSVTFGAVVADGVVIPYRSTSSNPPCLGSKVFLVPGGGATLSADPQINP